MHELFEVAVDRAPESLALSDGQVQWSYRELEARANQVAHALRALGVGPEVRVGLCTGRCPEMVVGLLGILKAGGAYVPLEPAYPRERLAFMLEDAQLPVLLTRSTVERALPPGPARVLRLDEGAQLDAWPTARPARRAAAESLAYVLYTSGSTGRPKGVQLEHRSLANLAREMQQTFDLGPDSRVLQHALLGFDLSVWELLAAWLGGGSLHLTPAEARLPGPALVRLLSEHAITHAMLPPSVLAALPEAQLPALRVLVSLGEACPAALVARWGRGRRFFNTYGPTEAAVYATLFECSSSQSPPPIGKPIAGVSVHLLDGQLQPVAPGAAGELYIGGAGLARGYLNRPELTAERFIPHPATGERLYRTGDLARELPDGNLEFLDRVDHQLKIRGHRVEPGEVEHLLARHPAVQSVVVAGHEYAPGDKRLVAYLVAQPGQSPGLLEWRRFAQQVLPEHMVPAAFVELPALPLTPNGKVDRRALPGPGRERPALATPFRPSLTPLQRTLESLWSQVLGVAPVGLDDDFLELGGDSLRAAALATRVREALGVELPPHEVLAVRTPARLAERLDSLRGHSLAPPPLVPATRPQGLPLSFAQQRLWFLHQLDPQGAAYNMALVLRLTGPLEPASLARSLESLLHRHEALRTTFPLAGDAPVQRIGAASRLELPRLELEAASEAQREARLAELARRELSRPFDLGEGPLVRACLLALGEAEHALLLAIHHTVFDGASMGVLVQELAALYEALLAGESSPLPELPVQYADYTLWQRQWLQGEVLQAGLAFWKRELEGAPRALELPADRPRPATPTFRGQRRAWHVPAPTARALEALARAEGATPFMALLAALGALLQRCTGSEDVLVGTPVAGRGRRELEGLIGFFANTLPLRIRLHGNPSFRELLARVREHCLAAYAHQEVPFERLVEALRLEREAGHQPLFQVVLAQQHPPPTAVTRSGLRLSLSEVDTGTAPFDLTWNLWEHEGQWQGTLLYSTELFEPQTSERLVSTFQALLAEVAAAPERRLSQLGRPEEWGLRPGPALAELEAALLAQPGVEDCAVRLRRPPGAAPLRVAYVAFAGARPPGPARLPSLPPHLAPDLVVPLHALPYTSQGQVDEAALQRLEVLDEQVAHEWESWLRQQPECEDAVVGVAPEEPQPALLHMADILPSARSAPPQARVHAPAEPATPATLQSLASTRPMASSDGGPVLVPEGAPQTLIQALVHTASTAGDKGITYVSRDGSKQHQSYAQLLHEARCLLTGLRAQGLKPGDRVILQIDSLRDHCTALWACLLGGIVPVTVAIAPTYETRNAVVGKLHGVWELLGRPPLLARARQVQALLGLRALLPMEELRILCIEDLARHPAAEHLHPAGPEEVAFLQLSSGSTGVPKCIQELHASVVCYAWTMAQVHRLQPRHVFLNWLPFDHVAPTLTYHLIPACLGLEQVHADTEWVLAEPLRWLDLIQAHGATHGWSPNFGFKLVNEALRRQPGRSWQLGSLERLMNAGEQVTLPVVLEFLELLAPFGVGAQVMQPAYGMAELCTAITYHNGFHPESGVHRVARSSLRGVLELVGPEDASAVCFIDVGPPNPGVQVRIVDPSLRLLPEGVIGRVQVRGRVVTPGYFSNEKANREALVGEGWFNTGDLGFLLGGRLTITGREKEIIIIRGAHLYCHDIEDLARAIEGVEPTCVAACSVEDPAQGTEGLALFFSPREMDLELCGRIITTLRERVTATFGVNPSFLVPVAREEFPKTTSGKIQRGALKEALAAGRYSRLLTELDLLQRGANTLPDWFYRRAWRPREAVVRAPGRQGTCLLFVDGLGLGARLGEELRRAGNRCVTVEAGAGFERLGRDAFRLPPEDGAAYTQLVATLAEEGPPLAQVLHLWTFDGQAPESSAEARARGASSLLLLSQALGRSLQGSQGVRLQVISNRAQPVAAGEPVDCDKALLLGLVHTIPQEVPWLDARHLDLPPSPLSDAAAHVLHELEVLQREREVAWRHGRRLVQRLEKVKVATPERQPLPLEAGGLYLLTGGLGTLGLELARRLLRHYQARLLLVGRTPLESQTQERGRAWQELLELAARHGGQVSYEAVDVCEPQALRGALARAESLSGRLLTGVFHLAGVLEERLLLEETLEHFAAVLRPKVEGTRALEELLAERPRAFLAGFSSVNATFGGFCAAAYSAANRFLEHFTQARHVAADRRRFCLAWSRWEGTWQAQGDAHERLANARGYQTLTRVQGWNSLLAGLGLEGASLLSGLDERSPHILSRLEGAAGPAGGLQAFFTSRAGGSSAPQAPPPRVRDRFGTPVACRLRQVAQLPRRASGAADFDALLAQERGRASASRERESLQSETEQKIASIWQELLGVEEIGALDNFFELGGHSLLLVQVHNHIEKAFSREINVLEMFRYPTVRALATWLSGQAAAQQAGGELSERARRQRAAQERHRQRRELKARRGSDE